MSVSLVPRAGVASRAMAMISTPISRGMANYNKHQPFRFKNSEFIDQKVFAKLEALQEKHAKVDLLVANSPDHKEVLRRVMLEQNVPRSDITRMTTLQAAARFKEHDRDTGSPAVVIATLTHRIGRLSEHLEKNTRDVHNTRSVRLLVTKRRKQLQYLKRHDFVKYEEVLREHKLRGV